MNATGEEYYSSIAGDFLQPLSTLIQRLLAREPAGLAGIKANHHEVSWSVSSIVLAVVMFESRLGWVHRKQGSLGPSRFNALTFYDDLRTNLPLLPDVTEIFVLRDVIAHNHVWKVRFESNEEGSRLIEMQHVAGGDRKFEEVADMPTGTSKSLGLHLVPSMIDRSDVKKVLNVIVESMTALCDANLLLPQAVTSVAIVDSSGRRGTLAEVAALI